MDSGITRTKLNTPPFYTIVSTDLAPTDKLLFQIEIKADHPVFKGHFPGFPVVPGAMMIKIFKELICGYFSKPYMLESSSDIKFLALIEPNENKLLQIEIGFRSDGSRLVTSIVVKDKETTCLKMSGIFSELPFNQ